MAGIGTEMAPPEKENPRNLIIKNTFFDVEEPGALDMRAMKSLPYSFKVAQVDGSLPVSVSFLDKEDEEEEEEEEHVADASESATQNTCVPDAPAPLDAPKQRRTGRVKSVAFTLPSCEDESHSNDAASTALHGAADESPVVCHLRTAAFDDDASPIVCRLRTAAFDDDASPIVCRLRTAAFEDGEASPAVCQLRTLSFNSTPRGPHLGLLWVPDGCMRAPAAPAACLQPAGPPPCKAQQDAARIPPWPRAPPTAAQATPGAAARAATDVAAAVRGQVWGLAQTAQGCRQVQDVLGSALQDREREALAAELKGCVWQAAQNPHANFVLQKFIVTMRPEALQFVLEELPPEVAVKAAKHKCGCRVIQRLVEKCPAWQVSAITQAILDDFADVARTPYGNYVVQCLAEHGSQDQRRRVMQLVGSDLKGLATDSFGCAVLCGVLSKGPVEDQQGLAEQMVREPGLLVFLACARHGSSGVLRALQVLTGRPLQEARDLLASELACLKASRFGRLVAAAL